MTKGITAHFSSASQSEFKVPHSRPIKKSAFTPIQRRPTQEQYIKALQYQQMVEAYKEQQFQLLLNVFLTNPASLSKTQIQILLQHPVIKQLVLKSKDPAMKNAEFFVPVTSLRGDQYSNAPSGAPVNVMIRQPSEFS